MKFEDLPGPEPEKDEPLTDNPEPPASNTPEAVKAPADAPRRREATRRYPPPPTAVPMLQPWKCTRCDGSGELECFSSDDCLYPWEQIVRLHEQLSPDCHPTKFLVTEDLKEKAKTHLADEEIARKHKDPRFQKKLTRKHKDTL